ncbi:MAG: extracellular matrix regulator RemB [Candidatus Fimivivens sp.]
MYLHLGQEIVVRVDDIIGIFDIETASIGKETRWFLSCAEKNMMVTNVSNDLPKSFIVCNDNGAIRVYISQISTATLKRRTGFIESL